MIFFCIFFCFRFDFFSEDESNKKMVDFCFGDFVVVLLR